MPPNLKKLEADIGDLARMYVDRMEALGGECDFVSEVAVWYPLRVIMTVLGVPAEDEAFMLKLTEELFGSTDPDMKREENTDFNNTVADFFNYFTAITEDRRKNPRDDVATVIANATIDGEPIEGREELSIVVGSKQAGDEVVVDLLREDKELTISVELGKRPE